MHGIVRTIGGLLVCGALSTHAAEPVAPPTSLAPRAAPEELALPAVPAAAPGTNAGVAAAASSLATPVLLATNAATELNAAQHYIPPAAGICPVIDDLVQQSCAQYPDDPSCLAR